MLHNYPLRRRANQNDALAHPASMKRDVSADRHDTWGGDAMDAAARETNVAKADGEVVWSWRPKAGAKFADALHGAGDGGKKAWSPGRARRKPLKPSRRECRLIRLNLW